VGLKFNPPPGWPLSYSFEPPPGWEPDPSWPPPPPGWPLWIGSGAPRGTGPAAPPAQSPQTYPAPSEGYGPPRPAGAGRLASAPFLLRVLGAALAFVVAAAVVAAYTAHRPVSTGRVTGTGQVSFFSLRAGDCFQAPPDNQLTRGLTVDVTAVPCTTAHSAQIFAQFRAPDGRYPGRKALVARAARRCRRAIAAKIDKSKVSPSTLVVYLFPDSVSWLLGRRAISCVAVDSARDLTASVLKASARS